MKKIIETSNNKNTWQFCYMGQVIGTFNNKILFYIFCFITWKKCYSMKKNNIWQ